MRILAIETSCDETAAAVVEDGRRVISNVIASQTEVHRIYRGVVPEIASRCHIEYALPVITQALELAGSDRSGADIDAVAVTRGPGLVGSLLVGVETAKTLAMTWEKPLIPVHHILGHLHSVFCELPEGKSRVLDVPPEEEERSEPRFRAAGAVNPSLDEKANETSSKPFEYPFLALVISGGHSSLIRADGPGGDVRVLGQTLDDAPGEAYDKVAKFLGLDYPGGPQIDRRAAEGDPRAFDLPRPILHTHGYNFSFSGLKTAVIQTIRDFGGLGEMRADRDALNNLCASFQNAVIDVLLTKARKALKKEGLKRLAVVGGVACNRGLRAEAARRMHDIHLVFPSPILCTDNAAMIAATAEHLRPARAEEALRLDARAGWDISAAARGE